MRNYLALAAAAFLWFAIPAVAQPPVSTLIGATREEINENIARRAYNDMINAYKFDDVERFGSEWMVQHNGPQGDVVGVKRWRTSLESLKTAFPDYKFDVKETIADGNKVAIRYRFSGTHKGDLFGIAPTGKTVTVWGIDYVRIEEGKIRETWGTPLTITLLNELGVLPGAAKTEPAKPPAEQPAEKTPPS